MCSSAHISGGGELILGDNVWVSSQAMLRASPNSTLAIGANTAIGPRCVLWTGTHESGLGTSVAAGKGCAKDISIGKGCWLGANSVVCPGVSIGDGTILAAGAVASKNVESKVLAAGVPVEIKKRG